MATIADAFSRLFSADGFVPRRICGRWPDWLVAEHIAGNALVWLAYVALPILIWRLARRRPELRPFRGLALSLAFFVGLCGLGHFLDMAAFFRPMYRLSGHVLIATGLVSWWTAWATMRAWPAIMAMKSPEELERQVAERTEELTRAIAELRRSEIDRAYLATIVESSNEAIISKDFDGVITSWNAGAERLFGYPAAEAIGRPVTFLFPPDHLGEEPVILGKLRAGEPIEPFETVRMTRDGRRIDVALSLSPIRDGSGRAVGVSKVVTDITERKRSAEALRDSERRFRALIETLPQLVWSTGAKGESDYLSPQWLDYSGCADSGEVKARWHEILHADDRARFESVWGASLASGEPYDTEYRMRRVDGAFRWFKVRGVPIRDADGRVVRWFGTCTDIHDQMLTEEVLRASERTYRAIGESIPFGIWICDAEGRNTYTSQSFLRLVGLSQAECAGYGWARTIHPDDAGRSLEAWKACVRDEGTWDAEQRIPRGRRPLASDPDPRRADPGRRRPGRPLGRDQPRHRRPEGRRGGAPGQRGPPASGPSGGPDRPLGIRPQGGPGDVSQRPQGALRPPRRAAVELLRRGDRLPPPRRPSRRDGGRRACDRGGHPPRYRAPGRLAGRDGPLAVRQGGRLPARNPASRRGWSASTSTSPSARRPSCRSGS